MSFFKLFFDFWYLNHTTISKCFFIILVFLDRVLFLLLEGLPLCLYIIAYIYIHTERHTHAHVHVHIGMYLKRFLKVLYFPFFMVISFDFETRFLCVGLAILRLAL